MRKAEFLKELEEALTGAVSASVLRENLAYYDQYISQAAASGRSEADVIDEIGSPRLIARTIIDSSSAAGERPETEGNRYGGTPENVQGSYAGRDSGKFRGGSQFHYVDLSKWYWRLLAAFLMLTLLFIVFAVVGGIFSLLMQFAGPIILIWLIYTLFRKRRR